MTSIEPEQIMAVVVSLIIMGIGIFAVSTIVTTQQATVSNTYTGHFGTNYPAGVKTCDTGRTGMTGITVTQFNGCATVAVTSTYVSYSGSTVTIAAGGLTP